MDGYRHRTVKHDAGEYVRNVGVDTTPRPSLWSMLKSGFVGNFHRMSLKHLHRHVGGPEVRKHNRELNTLDQMREIARGMERKRCCFRDLVA